MNIVMINQDFHFDAAHHLPNHDGLCKNVHGHRWDLQVTFQGVIGPSGMAEDFQNIKNFIKFQVIYELDHKDLNMIMRNPTAENLCLWIWDRITTTISNYLSHTTILREISLWESPDSYISYNGGVE